MLSPSRFAVSADAPTPGKGSTVSSFGNVVAPLGALDLVATFGAFESKLNHCPAEAQQKH